MLRWLFLCLLFPILSPLQASEGKQPVQAEGAMEETAVPSGGDFVLQSASGRVATRDLRGKVILLYFGYTKCPDVCPTSLSLITQAINELTGEELQEVVSLFVSVDPKRDTPQSLAEYVSYFHDNFIGVTGSPAEVAEAAKRYGAQYYEVELKDSALGYAVNHSSATYLIDVAGELRFVFPHETPPSVLLEAVRYLLAER